MENGGSDRLFGGKDGKALLVYLLEISFISQTKPSDAAPLLWLCGKREIAKFPIYLVTQLNDLCTEFVPLVSAAVCALMRN